MTKLLSGALIWPEIRRRSRRATVVRGAIAYLGPAGPDILSLPEDSILIVDMSDLAVRRNQTRPEAVATLIRTGSVRVFSRPGLHAKVIAFDTNAAIIGSMNASQHSSGWSLTSARFEAPGLVEAAVLITERNVVKQAINFVEAEATHPDAIEVTESVLAHALALPRDRQRMRPTSRHPPSRSPRRARRPQGGRLWLFSASKYVVPEDEEIADEIASKTPVSDARAFETTYIAWSSASLSRFARELSAGDHVLTIWSRGDRATVSEPARVLRVARRRLRGGRYDLAVLEARSDGEEIPFSTFERALKRHQIVARRSSTKEIPANKTAAVRGIFLDRRS